jgi:hypothetical protein
MIARGEGGHIVNTSSRSGLFASWQCGPVHHCEIRAGRPVGGVVPRSRTARHQRLGLLSRSRQYRFRSQQPSSTAAGTGNLRLRAPRRGLLRRQPVDGPREIGAHVLRGVRRNDAFIMAHPEFRDGMQARHDALIRALPNEPPNEARRELLIRFPAMLHNPIYDSQTTPGPLPDQSTPGDWAPRLFRERRLRPGREVEHGISQILAMSTESSALQPRQRRF